VTRRSLAARLARLEDRVVEPPEPIEYRVYFHDGTPAFPRPGEDPAIPLSSAQGVGGELVFRIASWEESELDRAWPAGSSGSGPADDRARNKFKKDIARP
jgi:hypothetical protein